MTFEEILLVGATPVHRRLHAAVARGLTRFVGRDQELAALTQALAYRNLGIASHAQGDYRRAIDCHRQAIAFFDRAQRHERFGQVNLPPVTSRADLAWCYAELGMFAEGSAVGEEGLRIAEAAAHPGSLMFAYWGVGMLSLRKGALHRALPLLERAVGICQDADLPVWFPRMAAALGSEKPACFTGRLLPLEPRGACVADTHPAPQLSLSPSLHGGLVAVRPVPRHGAR